MTQVQIVVNGLLLGGLYLLLAQGLNLIFGVMKIVNIAHGAFVVAAGLVVSALFEKAGVNPLLTLVIVAVMAFLVGAAVQYLVIERISSAGGAHEHGLLTLMATFGLSYIMINVAQRAFGADYRSVPYLQDSWNLGGLRLVQALVVGFGLAALFTALLTAWLRGTRSGRALRACSQSTIGADACGINAAQMRMIGFGLGSALAAAGGTLLVLMQPIAPAFATSFTLTSFVVIAIGGLGNYTGAAVGAAIVGVSQTFAGFYFDTVAQSSIPYVLLILVMLLRPQGLLARKAR